MGKLPRALSVDWPQEPCSVLPLHNRAITPLHLSMSFRPVATGRGGNLFGTTTGAYGDGPEFAFATRLSSSPNGLCASCRGDARAASGHAASRVIELAASHGASLAPGRSAFLLTVMKQ